MTSRWHDLHLACHVKNTSAALDAAIDVVNELVQDCLPDSAIRLYMPHGIGRVQKLFNTSYWSRHIAPTLSITVQFQLKTQFLTLFRFNAWTNKALIAIKLARCPECSVCDRYRTYGDLLYLKLECLRKTCEQ